MTKREYGEAIVAIIGGSLQEVEKANGVKYLGITRGTDGSNIAPTVYVDEFYRDGASVEFAAERIDATLKANERNGFPTEKLLNYEFVKPRLVARLYNKATKADVKRSAKGYGFSDLIIVPYIDITDLMPGAYSRVSAPMTEKWGVSEKEVIDTAIKNSKNDIQISTMNDIMREMAEAQGANPEIVEAMFPIDDAPQMYVITNKAKCYGAIGVMLAKAKMKEIFPEGFVVLPSSVHEAIVVSAASGEAQQFTDMVNDVNDTQVLPEEQLSNRAYVFAA